MTTTSDIAAEPQAASPEALLKAAVSGAKPHAGRATAEAPAAPTDAETDAKPAARSGGRFDALSLGLAGAALAIGTVLGAGTAILAAPRSEGTGIALAEINAALESNRQEASRLIQASERLDRSVAALKDASETARNETKTRGNALTEKVGKAEAALVAKIAALGERIDQSEKEQGARLASAAQAEKRPVAAATPVTPAAKAEPVQTGSIVEAKPKPAVIESWAVRDVYDGTAMLEDRRRRLVEVAIGDAIPGIGRVDAVERRGREWVVVTRQGIVTPQPW